MESALAKQTRDAGMMEGIVTMTSFLIDTPRAAEIDRILAEGHDLDPQRYRELNEELRALCQFREVVRKNRVVIGAREEAAKRYAGSPVYTGIINYGALGDSSAAVLDADAALGNEVARKLYATRTQTADSFTIDFYYSKADTNGTYEEFGMVIDGTATLDTGLLFNRVLTGGWTKTALEALTVSAQVNINPA